jgi:hypothetical protein
MQASGVSNAKVAVYKMGFVVAAATFSCSSGVEPLAWLQQRDCSAAVAAVAVAAALDEIMPLPL